MSASNPGVADVRAFLAEYFRKPCLERGLDPAALGDDFDLYDQGVVDSLGLMEMLTALEQRFGLEIDFETLEPEVMTVVGPLCRFVAAEAARGA